MATRGTIQFRTNKEQGSKNLGYVYIHHDMYTEGFRDYLAEVFENNTVNTNNLMTKFVKVIERSEITVSHRYHSDTEFRYEIFGSKEDNGEILVYQRDFDEEDERRKFKLKKAMKIKDFLINPEI
jgi:hypothetical protein